MFHNTFRVIENFCYRKFFNGHLKIPVRNVENISDELNKLRF